MKHPDICKCINCEGKGKPINEIYLHSVTAEDLSKIEVCDWLEGYGMIGSLAQQTYIRRYGFMLISLQTQKKALQIHLDLHTKVEGGISMDCGHPVQCAYAAAKVDGGPVCCSMCDLIKEKKVLKISNQGYKTTIKDLDRLISSQIEDIRDCVNKQRKINELNLKIKQLQNALTNIRLSDCEAWTKLKRDLEVTIINRNIAIEQRTADWERIKDLEKENENYSERVHNLEGENGRYFEQICNLQDGLSNINKLVQKLEAGRQGGDF